jgi:hypothetical protein
MNYTDFIYIISIIFVLIFAVYLLSKLNIKEKYMETVSKANRDMQDLEKISKNIESDYKPVNIELTSYEKEQEDNAIISYDELVKTQDSGYSYDESFKPESDVSVKRIDLDKPSGEIIAPQEKNKVKLLNYDKEEAFLAALKQLQKDLM